MNEFPVERKTATVNSPSDPFDELPVAYVEMDVHGVITRANRHSQLLQSSHAGELIGKLVWELMPLEEQEMSCAAFMTAIESGQDPPVARRSIYTSSGQYRTHQVSRNLIRDAEGKPVGMRAVTVDVTDAYKALEEISRASKWLECVLASISAALMVTDSLGMIRAANPAAEELLGWTAEEMKGKVIEKVLPVLSYLSADQAPLNFTMALDKPIKGLATVLDSRRREVRVEISASPILNKESGAITGVVSVLRRVEDAVST